MSTTPIEVVGRRRSCEGDDNSRFTVVKVIVVCGSLGHRSANRAALEVAARRLGHDDAVALEEAAQLDAIPVFRPDLVDQPPESVAEFRRLIEGADLVLVAAPEYAAGLAGGIKNALDWLVGSGSFYHRRVAVLSAGTTGGTYAIEQLVRTLTWQGALVVSVLGIDAPKTKSDSDGNFTDAGTIEAIETWAATASSYHSASAEECLQAVARIITPYAIDPSRLGTPS